MDVFISYNRRDSGHAAALNDWLTGQGATTFYDRRDLGSGQLWLPDLERAIGQEAHAVAVLVGPGGLGNTQQYEYQFALTRQAADPSFPIIPVILPGTPEWRYPRGFLTLQTWVDFSAGQDPAGLQRLLAAIRRVPVTDDSVQGRISPYKGLTFFSEDDSQIFFGREAESNALLDTVRQRSLAVVIGRSGSGKSSLVRAGLLPRLRRPTADGPGAVWDSVVLRPGQDPLAALAAAFTAPPPGELELDRTRRLLAQAEALRHDQPDFLAHHVAQRMVAARLRVDRLLIVVDQAEELFSDPWTLTDADLIRRFRDDGTQFMRLLLGAAEQGPVSLVLTIRSDFFDPLMHSPFADHLTGAQQPLGRLADLRPSIVGPAEVVGLRFASGLVERIVDEVGDEESNLPLMQHALDRTWRNRAGPMLTHDAYVTAGGVAQAINRVAGECYAGLKSDAERLAARRLFLRLVRPGVGGRHVRLPAAVPEDPEERRVMERFTHPDRRLLIVGERDGRAEVEIAHEALVRGWDTLRGWVMESRDRLRVRDAVGDWKVNAAPGELLPAGSALMHSARELLADPGDVRLDPPLAMYIRVSLQAADAAQVEERRLRQRQLVAALAAAAVLLVISLTATLFYVRSEGHRRDAVAQRAVAEEQHAEADRQRDLAERQRVVADEQRVIAEARERTAEEQRAVANAERERAEGERVRALQAAERAATAAQVAQGAANGLIFNIAQGLENQSGITVGAVSRILETAMDVIDQMLRYSPDDPALLRLKAVASTEFADTYARVGETGRQLAMAEQSVAISRGLAEAAPADRDLQRGLSVSHEKVGDVLVSQGKLGEALTVYRASLDIRERLASADPGNAGWQRDLSVSHNKVGDVLVAQGKLGEALTAYRAGLNIAERLASADPGDAGWQGDLSVSHAKMASAYRAGGQTGPAKQHLIAGRKIIADLVDRFPAWDQWKKDLAWFDAQLAALGP